MRTWIIALIIVGLSGCAASVRRLDVSKVPTFTVATLDASDGAALGEALASGDKAFVVRLREGDTLPVNLRASFGPIALEPGENHLVFAEDTWLYFGPAGVLLSPDMERWAPLHDGAALSKLFGLGKGTFQIGLGVPKGQPASVSITVEKQ
ncbi:MAG: hypothetical protein H6744_17870 [Deltaproteobacteria bacterium]|nr:hypothetical protein [Deltaproteobacteria bacterium]